VIVKGERAQAAQAAAADNEAPSYVGLRRGQNDATRAPIARAKKNQNRCSQSKPSLQADLASGANDRHRPAYIVPMNVAQ
jgi:hypothetical protein